MPEMSTTQPAQGWICPVCRAVYAPWVASCLQCPKAMPSSLVGSVSTIGVGLCPVCAGRTDCPPAQGCRCDEYHTTSYT